MFNVGDLVTLHPDYVHYTNYIEYCPFTIIKIHSVELVYAPDTVIAVTGNLGFYIKDLIPYHPYGISKPIKG